MDLLSVPNDPSFPALRAPFICTERWDGRRFLTYAHRRKAALSSIPYHLRNDHSEEPFTEALYPRPQAEQEAFVQTWFFFGLLAEFLGLNDTDDNGAKLIEAAQAEAEIAALFSDYVVTEGETQYLAGARLLECRQLVCQRNLGPDSDHQRRLDHLSECIRFASLTIDSAFWGCSDPIKFSVGALAEACWAILYDNQMSRPNTIKPTRNWTFSTYALGSKAEENMAKAGWCRSDIERTKFIYKGLHTTYFASRLKRPLLESDQKQPLPASGQKLPLSALGHERCSSRMCVSAQIDDATYQLSHAPGCSKCPETGIDHSKVKNILEDTTTSSFPVLYLTDTDTPHDNVLCVEEYKPGTPFVAISHVWADGLGNPRANRLHTCQVKRLRDLVRNLESLVKGREHPQSKAGEYRLWIDTLCCPVEEIAKEGTVKKPTAKDISIQRIADVYHHAAHVLVLDSSLSSYRLSDMGQASPAECLLRILSTSTWMRRLWTLQEGALARSLYFQFNDGPIQLASLRQQLFDLAELNVRYTQLRIDIDQELINICGFFKTHEIKTKKTPWPNLSPASLTALMQQSLIWRAVSKPKDEPLCIANLLSLSSNSILKAESAECRMIELLKLIEEKLNGFPKRIIFYVDNPLQEPGWAWAPRSLLSWDSDLELDSELDLELGSELDFYARSSRFNQTGYTKPKGKITKHGLRIESPGFLLKPKAWLTAGCLLLWKGIEKVPREHVLVLHSPISKKYYHLSDQYRAQKLSKWSAAKLEAYDRKKNWPLRTAISQGNVALICDESMKGPVRCCLMVETADGASNGFDGQATEKDRYVRILRRVQISELHPVHALVCEKVEIAAERVAKDVVTRDLLSASGGPDGEVYRARLEKVKQKMKEVMADIWEHNPDFVQAVRDTISQDFKDKAWALIPLWFPFRIVAKELRQDQVWVVDGTRGGS